jgi:hypothetical protein
MIRASAIMGLGSLHIKFHPGTNPFSVPGHTI